MSKNFVFTPSDDDILIEFVQKNREIFYNAHLKHKDVQFKKKIIIVQNELLFHFNKDIWKINLRT